MNQQYALPVYFLIVGNLCLGYLLSPFFPILLPLSRHVVHSPISIAKRSFQRQHHLIHTLTCTTPVDSSNESGDEQLRQELMQVFGDDSLWQRAQQPQTIKKLGKNSKHSAHKTIPTANPISAGWSTLSGWLPFNNDLDLGTNSDTDIYVQFLAKKNWALASGMHLDTAQIFRYGSSSKNYAETNLDLTQQLKYHSLFSTQLNVSKSQNEEYTWSNRTFQKLSLLSKNNISYGVFSTGDYENRELRVNEWGPYFSWKRPVWRNWIFMENDINYLNIPSDKQDNHFNYQMSFEMHF
ncbi:MULTISPECIES: selenocysteine synthase [Acinetobacter]|uniref:Selenocysteine synthase n=1 Tax=Acinetobacter corruptisaponis TaxID=3045147 RepID=A0ABY8RYQ0_9GAMM|nr:selenocysteine synthase [Acinetobacter sp. KCTC 92772]WHP04295.1 selenocysteine synthase [Acinetobacter sp. KCTC 92772]